ncbi:MAG: transcription termination/antitermination protein NusA [Epsilonproteobacteria bacterium]|nr:transcription termination/antitermination protein NusA [Campylobacterota bacterium]NPA89547.1 transcription termination/antitermination protein NusA [Campylobacterota bacterium]
MGKVKELLSLVANEKGLDFEEVKKAFERSVIRSAKKILGEDAEIEVDVGDDLKIYQVFQVTNSDEAYDHPNRYLYLDEAQELDPEVELGDTIKIPIDIGELGKRGAYNFQREFEREIIRLLENEIYRKLLSKLGTIISGEVMKVDNDGNTWVDLGQVKGVLPLRNRIKGEEFKPGDRLKALLRYVNFTHRRGITIELSRTSPKFLERLIEQEVPEVKDGLVKIEGIARIPGVRAKVAVTSLSPKIEPVGAVIGKNGTRINAVANEVRGENIDVLEYSPNIEVYIARALAPAIVKSVKVDKGKGVAYVEVDKDQAPKAIGKKGSNITLASMLTKYRIELVDSEEKKKKDLSKLENLFKI